MKERKEVELQKLIYFRGAKIPDFEANALQELEEIVKKQFLLSNQISWHTPMNFSVKNDRVVEIGLYNCKLKSLSKSISNLRMLQILDLRYNKLRSLPESIGNLTSLRLLYISYNQLSNLPESIGKLSILKSLLLDFNRLITIPESIGNLTSLENLYLNDNKLTTLPESIGNLTSLENLYLSYNQLSSLPESIVNLVSLQKLDIWSNPLLKNPNSMIKTILKTLKMNGVDILFGAAKFELNDILSWHNSGDMYLEKKEYDKAIECYEKVIELNPNVEYVWHSMGDVYLAKKDYDKAIKCYKKVIELDPNNENAWYDLGDAYFEINDYDKASECYGKLDDMNMWYHMGNAFFKKNEYEEAIECYEIVITLDPFDDNSWYNIGNAYYKKMEFDLAIENLKRALEINPENFDAWWCMDETYEAKGQHDKAIECLQKALEIYADDIYALYNMGKTYEAKGQHDKAIECLQKALEIDPEYIIAWWRMGNVYSKKDEHNKAIECYEKVITLDPFDDGSWYNLGNAYYSKKDFNSAIKSFKGAREINPENFNAWYNLGNTYLKSELYNNVINLCNNFMENKKELNYNVELQEMFETLKKIAVEKKDNILRKEIKSPSQISKQFDVSKVKVLRGGNWKIKGNQSIFNFKIKLLNKSKFVLTNIQIFLTSIPNGLESKNDRYKIGFLYPNSSESPAFKLIAKKSCVGDVIKGIVTYIDPFGNQRTVFIAPFEIKYVCSLLVPKQVTNQEFKKKTALMDEKEIIFDCNLDPNELEQKLGPILKKNNFFLIQQLQKSQNVNLRRIDAFAQGLYDKQDVALSLLMQKQEEGTKLVIKGMSERVEKLTDILKEISTQCDDIKSDTELIKEYTSQIEDLFEELGKLEDIEAYLKEHLASDWEKIKDIWEDYKAGKISRKELIWQSIKIIGKKFVKRIISKVVPI